MSRDHFWRLISRDTNVEVSALSSSGSKVWGGIELTSLSHNTVAQEMLPQ